MSKDAWQPRRVIEADYRKALKKLMSCLSNLIAGLEVTTPEAITDALRRYVTLDFFRELARAAARKMVTMLRVDGAKTWREAARKSSRGTEIYRALREEMKGPIGARVHQIVEENAKLISTFPDEIGNRVAKAVLEMQQQGLRSTAMARELAKQFPEIAQSRIDLIARTETSKASTALTQARAENMGVDWYIWRTSRDARVRPAHMKMDGVLCRWADPPAPEVLHGEKSAGSYQAGGIYNCFPGSIEVNLSNGCDKLWRRWYEGPLVNLELPGSTLLKATPNHPILTSKGWFPINKIKEGDYLVHAFVNSGNVGEADENQFIPSFSNLFDSLRGFETLETKAGTEFDFHGDRPKNDVDVINVDTFLSDNIIPKFLKSFGELDFPKSYPDGRESIFDRDSFLAESLRIVFSSHGLIGLANKFFSFIKAKFGHSDEVRFTSTPSGNQVSSEYFGYGPPATSVSVGDGKLAFPSDVSGNYLILWQLILAWTMSKILNYNVINPEILSKGLGFASSHSGYAFKGSSIFYKKFKVLDLFNTEFSGHVFNLQSFYGYYNTTRMAIASKNCRCYPQPLLDAGQVRWPAKVHAGGSIERMTQAEFQRRFGEHRRMAA